LCQKLTAGWFTLDAAEDVDGTGIETGVDSSVADISVPLLLLLAIHSMSKTRSPMRNPRSFKCPSFNFTNVAIVIPSSERENKNALKLQKGKKNDKEDTFTHMKNTFIHLKH